MISNYPFTFSFVIARQCVREDRKKILESEIFRRLPPSPSARLQLVDLQIADKFVHPRS